MLSLIVFLPLAAGFGLLAVPRIGDSGAKLVWVTVAAAETTLTALMWARYRPPPADRLAFEEKARWIPGINSSYHVGVDGLSLPLVIMTAVIFLACAVYGLRGRDRSRLEAALFLFLQAVSLGLFVSADLILFFVFFDLSIVAMYFVIAGWATAMRAARRSSSSSIPFSAPWLCWWGSSASISRPSHIPLTWSTSPPPPRWPKAPWWAGWCWRLFCLAWRSRPPPFRSIPGCLPPTPTRRRSAPPFWPGCC
ncbi:putative membrane protein [Mycobacterium xenopi 4042]|uniref:Putative membrane protein n=1 Tax=Mycobacterium xenopi 4042 TaxID=1299334 RepID=X8AAJ9_MYCXE|nr:putative membrane protein [Mycobacterium xenopi 4042]